MLRSDKCRSCTWKCPDSSFTPTKDISCFQVANLEANSWCAMSQGPTTYSSPPSLQGSSGLLSRGLVPEKRILWCCTMAQPRKGTDMDPLALAVSIPTGHLSAFQCLLGRTGLEETWDNGSHHSGMPREFLLIMMERAAWCRVTQHQHLRLGLLC